MRSLSKIIRGVLIVVAAACVSVRVEAGDLGRSIFGGPKNSAQSYPNSQTAKSISPWQGSVPSSQATTGTPKNRQMSIGGKQSSSLKGQWFNQINSNMYQNSGKRAAAPNGNAGYTGIGLSQPWQKRTVIAAPNGNTGITGGGLPAPRIRRVVPAPNGNTGISGIGLPQPWQSAKVIAAQNGNTGITGAGLPAPPNRRIVPAPNGNTGISGIGLPQPWPSAKVIAAPNGNTGITGAGLPPNQPIVDRSLLGSGQLQPTSNQATTIQLQQTQGLFGEIGGAIDGAVDGAIGLARGDFLFGKPRKPITLPEGETVSVPFNDISNEAITKKKPVSIKNSNKVDGEANVRKVSVNDSSTPQAKATMLDRYEYENVKPSPIVAPSPPASNPAPPAPKAPELPSDPPAMPAPQRPTPVPYPMPVPQYPAGRPIVVTAPQQVVVNSTVHNTVVDPAASESASQPAAAVDLVLEDITLSDAATLVAGPAYKLKFRNQSLQAVGSFHVAILAAVDGKLAADAPRAVVEVSGLQADEAGEVTLRLPASAMRITMETNEQPREFTHLFIAVDASNRIAELDETNNLAIVEKAALEPSGK